MKKCTACRELVLRMQSAFWDPRQEKCNHHHGGKKNKMKTWHGKTYFVKNIGQDKRNTHKDTHRNCIHNQTILIHHYFSFYLSMYYININKYYKHFLKLSHTYYVFLSTNIFKTTILLLFPQGPPADKDILGRYPRINRIDCFRIILPFTRN